MKNDINVQEQHEQLPSFYWLPKVHKISMVLGSLLLQIHAPPNSSRHDLLLVLKQYLSIINNIVMVFITILELIVFGLLTTLLKYWTELHQINKTSRARKFDNYDFATLYTNILHNALKNNIRSLVCEAFQIRGAKYVIVDRHGNGHLSLESASSTACVSVSKSKLVEWTEYVIDNVYIKVGNNVYRQTIGIPMGTDCAPQLANLFLFHYEHLHIKNLMRDNLCMAKRFSNTVRYIDNSHFEEIPNIYPPELTLKRTSESDTKLSYLDISISICSSKCVTEVYDKRDAFNFNIVNFPYMSSNIPSNPTYSVYISQLIRISRTCDTFQSFVIRHRLLTERLTKQGFWYSK